MALFVYKCKARTMNRSNCQYQILLRMESMMHVSIPFVLHFYNTEATNV